MTRESFCVNCQCATKGQKKSANCCAYCMTKGFRSNLLSHSCKYSFISLSPFSIKYLNLLPLHLSIFLLISISYPISPSHLSSLSASPFSLCFACFSRTRLFMLLYPERKRKYDEPKTTAKINRQKILDRRRSTRPMSNINMELVLQSLFGLYSLAETPIILFQSLI